MAGAVPKAEGRPNAEVVAGAPKADVVVAGAPKAEVVVAAGVLPNAEPPEPSVEGCPKDEVPNTDAAGFPKAEFEPKLEGCPNADVVAVGVPNADGVLLLRDPKAPLPVAGVGAEGAPKALEPEGAPNADGVDDDEPKAPPPPKAPLDEPKAEEVEGKADDDVEAVLAAERALLCLIACSCSAWILFRAFCIEC